MGLFGALFTGVSALFAQSQNTAIISNNIANVSTTGFKRSQAAFQSLVTGAGASRYSPGTVNATRLQRVDLQGSLQQTSSTTDASVSGNGFFPVKRSTDFGQEFLYTRNGQFSEDSQGLLRNAAGYLLYAWPLDADGELPSNQGDLSSLVVADVAFLGGLTRPTTTAELAINLDADQERTNWTGTGATFAASGPAHFTRGLTVYDSLGSQQAITMEFRHVRAPTALAVSSVTATLERDTDLAILTGIADGDRFSMTVDATTVTYEYDSNSVVGAGTGFQTVGELIDFINTDFDGLAEARIEDGELIIEVIDNTHTLTLNDIVNTPITGATALNMDQGSGAAVVDNVAISAPTLPTGNTGTVTSNSEDIFPDFEDLAAANPQGWWEVSIIHPNESTIITGLINFNRDGSLNAAADADGDIDIQIPDTTWGNGSDDQTFGIDISRFSQFAGQFNVIFSDQNGAELGLRTGIELTREGLVVARFSNGASANLYQIPLVTFASANGLTEVSGTAYTKSEDSGEENLREAGTGGAGFVEPSTLEASNVDLADEFAGLIVSQRAFGANTRVINTIDQMTEDLLRLR